MHHVSTSEPFKSVAGGHVCEVVRHVLPSCMALIGPAIVSKPNCHLVEVGLIFETELAQQDISLLTLQFADKNNQQQLGFIKL